ncbi:hypothetical protein BN59_01494 [Legionella massiliensis]|uniref:Uncharacterized protein n=1 Tax=Legionella massiliensis TaxID=1034943 RepID=A0A078KW31_9GAMM|nr:hypothetical protein [Legionella massiliensis]CDZ77212.1 hypothetical protein BN59_01494 [Legionella massiliensis]CEE12950.1 hypothetical protein BN1094_01494 [Legionella massiliensis]
MGRVKEVQHNREIEEQLIAQLKLIVFDDERAEGIKRQLISKGFQSLSHKQKYIYKTKIIPSINDRFKQCIQCLHDIDTEIEAISEFEWLGYVCECCYSRLFER